MEPVIVGINPQSLAVTDPEQIYDLLINAGLSAVTTGYATEVLGLVPHLQPSRQSHPRILLVSAFAYLSRGEYFTAAGYIARCILAQNNLSALDQHFLCWPA